MVPNEDSEQLQHPRSLIISSQARFWRAKGAKFVHAENEDSDQTVRMSRLICLRLAYMSAGTFSHIVVQYTSRKHDYIILTPLNPTFIK